MSGMGASHGVLLMSCKKVEDLIVYCVACLFDLNSPRGPSHAIGTEFYPVLRPVRFLSILGRILVNFPILN